MADYDSPWKDVLDGLFEDCLALFFPELHAAVDWSRGIESLEQELRTISPEAVVGLRIADKLVKVWRKDGLEAWLLVHIEIQNQPDKCFSERMFTSNYRIRDKYAVHPISLAILGDTQASWRPDCYAVGEFGCEVVFRFPMVKLSDFESQREILEKSPNPFSRVVLSHLATLKTSNNPPARYTEKLRMLKQLYDPPWPSSKVIEVLKFIDWVMGLPKELDQKLKSQIEEYERGISMPYVTSFERLAKEEGHQEGREEGRETTLRSVIAKCWKSRFGDVPTSMLVQLQALKDIPQLDELFDASLNQSMAEIEVRLLR